MSSAALSVHCMLNVTDMDRAVAFYTAALGFKVTGQPAQWWTNLACDAGGLGLNGFEGSTPGKTGLSLMVANLEAGCEAVVAAGGALVQVHEVHPGSTVRLAEVSDTEGNSFLLAQQVQSAGDARAQLKT